MLNIAQEKTQSVQSEEIVWSNLGFYIVSFNVTEKSWSAPVEHLSFKNQTLKVVLWRHRVLRCSTEAQDKGRFAYVQCKFNCSESRLKYSAPTLPKSQWGPTLHLLPLHSTGTGDSSMPEHQVQRGVNWMKPRAGWEKKICFRKISQQLPVNLSRYFATSGTVTPALVHVPSCPLCCPTPRRGTVSSAKDTCWEAGEHRSFCKGLFWDTGPGTLFPHASEFHK